MVKRAKLFSTPLKSVLRVGFIDLFVELTYLSDMNNGDCLICWDFIGNESGYGKVEPCSHVFCMKCIQKWTKVSESNRHQGGGSACIVVVYRSTEEINKKILN